MLRAPTTWWDPDGPAFVLLTDRRPTLGAQVPVLLTEDLAAQASLEVGDTLTLTVLGVPTGLEVAGTVPYVRTVADGSGGVLVDAATVLPTLLAAGATPEPDEWWLTVRPGAEEAVADALTGRPDVASVVLTGDEVLAQLDDDPSTGGSALGQVLLLTAAGCLTVGVLLLVSVALLRRRERAEQARMLGAAGGDRRALTGVLSWEYAIVGGAGVVVGVLAGAAVAAVTLRSMTLGPDGQLLQPVPELVVPWPAVVAPALLMVVVPLLAMVWLIRRDHSPGLGATETAGGHR
jgi:predicted lysophospholipase L1 biosynthesis ABC-type transport system permease subunit